MKVRMISKELWDKWSEWDKQNNDRIGIVIEQKNIYGIEMYFVKQITPQCRKGYERKWMRVEECQTI